MAKGAYCLCIKIRSQIYVVVGALGRICFEEGRYVYVGSAMNGLEARIRRHLDTSRGTHKAIHWHVDYLLKEEGVDVESIHVQESNARTECSIADAVSGIGAPVKGFGCSDCRCLSHLFKVEGCEPLDGLGLERKELSDYSV